MVCGQRGNGPCRTTPCGLRARPHAGLLQLERSACSGDVLLVVMIVIEVNVDGEVGQVFTKSVGVKRELARMNCGTAVATEPNFK